MSTNVSCDRIDSVFNQLALVYTLNERQGQWVERRLNRRTKRWWPIWGDGKTAHYYAKMCRACHGTGVAGATLFKQQLNTPLDLDSGCEPCRGKGFRIWKSYH